MALQQEKNQIYKSNNMELIRVVRTSIRKGAWATYAFRHYKLEVYVRHNKPCRNYWGPLVITAYKNMNDGTAADKAQWEFDNYHDFITLRRLLAQKEFETLTK